MRTQILLKGLAVARQLSLVQVQKDQMKKKIQTTRTSKRSSKGETKYLTFKKSHFSRIKTCMNLLMSLKLKLHKMLQKKNSSILKTLTTRFLKK